MITKLRSMRRFSLMACAVVLLAFSACLDKIDLEVAEGFGNALAIQARLLKGNPSIITMQVSQLFDFTATSRQPVNVREHFLVDDEGNRVELIELGNGSYEYVLDESSPIQVDFGKSYKLEVATFDNRRYESTMETLFPVPEPESMDFTVVTRNIITGQGENATREEVQFSITTPVRTDAGTAGVLWELQRSWKVTDSPVAFDVLPKTCYVTETVGKDDIKLVNPDDIISDEVIDFPLFESAIDYRFAQGYYFTAIQYSLSQGAFEYWNNVRQLLSRSGNMFESPAGKIQTNFFNTDDPDDEVFGYFYVTEADTIRLSIDSTSFGPMSVLCPPPPRPPNPGECPFLITCCDCLREPVSTTVKPDYWK